MPKRKGVYLITIITQFALGTNTEQFQSDDLSKVLDLIYSRLTETPHPMDCIITLNNPKPPKPHR